MPLHPQAKAFLDGIAALNPPDISEAGAFVARSNSHGEPDISGPIDPTVRIDNRFFTSSTADTYIKVYTPAGSGPFNALVYFHGGGWVVNYVAKYDAQCAALATMTNSVVISINYQKAPEHPYPAAFNDCYATLQWLVANAEQLSIDRTSIGVGGDSAGANLASAVALKAVHENLISLAFQLLIYPCNDAQMGYQSAIDNAEGYGLSTKAMKWFWQQYLSKESDRSDPYAVPITAKSLKGVAPAVLIAAEFDPLTDDVRNYYNKLIRDSVPAVYKEFVGQIHGFFNLSGITDDANSLYSEIAIEINAVLGRRR